jgi:hypothetical protein
MANGEDEYFKQFVWKPQYDQLTDDVKDDIRKRIAFALFNYQEAKVNYYYLVKLRENGLNPSNSALLGNGFTLWWWVVSATIISLGTLIDGLPNTNSVTVLCAKLDMYSKQYPELVIVNLPRINPKDEFAVEIIKLRGNVFAHSNEKFLQSIRAGKFKLNDDMAKTCLTSSYALLKSICDQYFNFSIPEDLPGEYDEEFARGLSELVKNKHN